jgi:hypothetical protein
MNAKNKRPLAKTISDFTSRFHELIAQILRVLVAVAGLQSAFKTVHFAITWTGIKTWFVAHPKTSTAFMVVGVMIVGFVISRFKQRNQQLYGLVEIAFGAVVTYNTLMLLRPGFDYSRALGVGTAMYIIARGFNNIADARKAALAAPAAA